MKKIDLVLRKFYALFCVSILLILFFLDVSSATVSKVYSPIPTEQDKRTSYIRFGKRGSTDYEPRIESGPGTDGKLDFEKRNYIRFGKRNYIRFGKRFNPSVSAATMMNKFHGKIPEFDDTKPGDYINRAENGEKITKEEKIRLHSILYPKNCNLKFLSKLPSKKRYTYLKDCSRRIGRRSDSDSSFNAHHTLASNNAEEKIGHLRSFNADEKTGHLRSFIRFGKASEKPYHAHENFFHMKPYTMFG